VKLLDLFCGAGGAAMGYHRAGFTEIVGVDHRPMPRYPFQFEADALNFCASFGAGFDAIHASPPCEHWSQLTPQAHRANHPPLIAATRLIMQTINRPFVIENVPSAKRELLSPFMLCGSMFGLPLRRHRFFEVSWSLQSLIQPCAHQQSPVLISGTHRRTYEPRYEYPLKACADAAGIDWMTRAELDKAIPPAYTEHIGKQLIEALR
jgi:DNA (cytosine-5)-methyltransferase 1